MRIQTHDHTKELNITLFQNLFQTLSFLEDLFLSSIPILPSGTDPYDLLYVIGSLYDWVNQLIQVFLVKNGFVDYDPDHPLWRNDAGYFSC